MTLALNYEHDIYLTIKLSQVGYASRNIFKVPPLQTQ